MINITDKHKCCGCSACSSICPKHCIEMRTDYEGFLYPIVKNEECIDCGLCEKVCNELHPYEERKPLKVLAATNKDDVVRMHSSSGGIFHILAQETISEGGVVFGARFDKQWQVVIDYAEDMKGIEAFMGSKYVQARMETAYVDAKRFLTEGRKVLFSGTPCQIAGLHKFLKKPYDNLSTVDFICHGTPSPKVWSIYLDEVVSAGRKAINDVQFRNKNNGWKKFNFVLSYNHEEKSHSLSSWFATNHYMRAFLHDMILRPSCYQCQAKSGRSQSDITIADFWGIHTVFPEMDDDKGTGLLIINTAKGQSAVKWNKLIYKETSAESAFRHNPSYFQSVSVHPRRESFFTALDSSTSVIDLIEKSLRKTVKQRIRLGLIRVKNIIKLMLKKLIGGGKYTLTHQSTSSPLDSHTTFIPSIPHNAPISAITFRNKNQGWKTYRMEISLTNGIANK